MESKRKLKQKRQNALNALLSDKTDFKSKAKNT
jgi:hypothetical protein